MFGWFPVFLGWTSISEAADSVFLKDTYNTVTRPAVSLKLATLPFLV